MSWHITFGRLISFSRDSSAAANDIEGEPLHPKENPILQAFVWIIPFSLYFMKIADVHY